MVTHKYLGWILLLSIAQRICTVAHLVKPMRWMSKIGKSRLPVTQVLPKGPLFKISFVHVDVALHLPGAALGQRDGL